MASELFVDNITGKTGTSGGAPITLSGDTATLSGTGVTFPTGHVTNFISRQYELASNHTYTNNAGADRVATRESSSSAVVPNFTAKQGFTYRIEYNFYATVARASGNSSGRNAEFKLFYDTTSRSQGDSTIGGTDMIGYCRGGRDMASSASSGSQESHIGVYLNGSFYHSGSDATMYVYYTTATDGGNTKNVISYIGNGYPMTLMITEFKGNCATLIT